MGVFLIDVGGKGILGVKKPGPLKPGNKVEAGGCVERRAFFIGDIPRDSCVNRPGNEIRVVSAENTDRQPDRPLQIQPLFDHIHILPGKAGQIRGWIP
ncbi:MAG: hypothetical protein A4E74_02402 [Syntrophus sp. PtaB.Bin075]|nr:MAG: hypothetical protein A4E74_02402 [Syntrophus sp. PtaB.Bin075]